MKKTKQQWLTEELQHSDVGIGVLLITHSLKYIFFLPVIHHSLLGYQITNPVLLLPKPGVITSSLLAFSVYVNWATEGLEYLVEEALTELVHGALQLAALALPLLVVAHRLSCGPLPCGGSGVVVHVVVPAPLVHSLLPAVGEDREEEGGLRGSYSFQ